MQLATLFQLIVSESDSPWHPGTPVNGMCPDWKVLTVQDGLEDVRHRWRIIPAPFER